MDKHRESRSSGNGGVPGSFTIVLEKAAAATERMADAGRKALEKIDEQRETAAGTLDTAASTLHQTADSLKSGAERRARKVAGTAHATADKIHSTAEYIRDHDLKAMKGDITLFVRKYPAPSLLISAGLAAGFGFLVGRLLNREFWD